MNNNFFYIPNKTNIDEIQKLSYNNTYNIIDNSSERLIYAPLNYDINKYFFIETTFLKVKSFKNNILIVEIDNKTCEIFDKIDDISVNLISNITDTYSSTFNSNDISYIPATNETTLGIHLSLTVTNNTNAIIGNKHVDNQQININKNDYARIVIHVNSINVYPNKNLCHTKLFVKLLDIKKINLEDFNDNIAIKDYVFSSNDDEIYKNVIKNNSNFICDIDQYNNAFEFTENVFNKNDEPSCLKTNDDDSVVNDADNDVVNNVANNVTKDSNTIEKLVDNNINNNNVVDCTDDVDYIENIENIESINDDGNGNGNNNDNNTSNIDNTSSVISDHKSSKSVKNKKNDNANKTNIKIDTNLFKQQNNTDENEKNIKNEQICENKSLKNSTNSKHKQLLHEHNKNKQDDKQNDVIKAKRQYNKKNTKPSKH